jgi:isopenicillin-N N-acyltransferase-like protein
MFQQLRLACPLLVLLLLACSAPAHAQAFRFPEARHDQGELRYVEGIPVLTVRGTHAEMGEQIGKLALKPAAQIIDMINGYATRGVPENVRPAANLIVSTMVARFPKRYRDELNAMAEAADVDKSALFMANTIIDLEEMVGCSSLLVNKDRSTTGGTLYGRNVDMPYVKGVADFSLLIVYHPDDGHAFAMPNLPGFLMLMSGMNCKGLAMGSQSVGIPRDGSGRFSPLGISSAVAGRSLMEGCVDVDEARTWLEENHLMRCVSLAACDPQQQTVLEITTKRVLPRTPKDGLVYATNHFRRPELGGDYQCWRYARLEQSRRWDRLGVVEVAAYMKSVNQGLMTVHTMIFEPASLRLHLAMGPGPATSLPLTVIDLSELLN